MFTKGQNVKIRCDIPEFNGKVGKIVDIRDGSIDPSEPVYHLAVPNTKTGQYRALPHQILFIKEQSIGFACDNCGGSEFLTSGTCLTCANCGTNSGGCS